jgi:hypothetical protein
MMALRRVSSYIQVNLFPALVFLERSSTKERTRQPPTPKKWKRLSALHANTRVINKLSYS